MSDEIVVPFNIVAPICSVNEVEEVVKAGANEIYFGIMPYEWIEKYGDSDFISRRQSEISHISKIEDLQKIAEIAYKLNCQATLVLNSKYTEKQIPCVLDLISKWEFCSGHSVMVSDLNILFWLKEQNSRLKRHLSVLSGVFNSYSVEFYRNLGVSRIVLPRELTLSEMEHIIRHSEKNMEFEIIAMFQKCEFIDSFCNFYHAFNFQPFILNDSDDLLKDEKLPIISCFDINYKGHGCQLKILNNNNKEINHLKKNEFETPFCAACQLKRLQKAGIFNFKIAGRGYPIDLIVKAIKFLRYSFENSNLQFYEIKRNYISTFGKSCNNEFCYYK